MDYPVPDAERRRQLVKQWLQAADDLCKRDDNAERERMTRLGKAIARDAEAPQAEAEAGPVTFGPRLMRWLETYRQESQS